MDLAAADERAALLLTRLAAMGFPVDRTGEGTVAEMYPAACLRRWGLTHRGYKRGEGHGFLVDHLLAAAPWSNDAFDAVIAALGARAIQPSATSSAPPVTSGRRPRPRAGSRCRRATSPI